MKKIFSVIVLVGLLFVLTGCDQVWCTLFPSSGECEGVGTLVYKNIKSYYATGWDNTATAYGLVSNYNRPISAKYVRQQTCGDKCCNCYANAYYNKIVNNVDTEPGGTECPSSCSCTQVVNTSIGTDWNKAFKEIVVYGRPVLAHAYGTKGSTTEGHWFLLIGVKKSTIDKYKETQKISASKSDFLIMDAWAQQKDTWSPNGHNDSTMSYVFYNAAAVIPYRDTSQKTTWNSTWTLYVE